MKNLHQIREVSTLSFNERVLQEAEDRRNPLMERVKFLGIFSSNMDEFFKVRVASIHRRIELGNRNMAPVLEAVTDKSRELDQRFLAAYGEITGALAREGVHILTEQDLAERGDPGLEDWVREYFRADVAPSLVPIILRPDLPFPQISDSVLYFGIKMWAEEPRYALLELPDELDRFVELPDGSIMYVDDVVRFCLDEIFYIFEYDRAEAFEFKISRDAELDIDNDFSEGYVRKMQRVLEQRKGGRPVRLVIDRAMPPGLRGLLLNEFKINEEDSVIAGGRYHNMKDLMDLSHQRPDLSFEKLDPAPHPVLDRDAEDGPPRPVMDVLREGDQLLTYPYQPFDHLIRLLREAAIDPDVTAINMTLYRAARRSQVVYALYNAARNGKRVFVSIELQARFDEKNNIKISQFLSEAGVTVVYGVPPMKTHAKLLLIERKDGLVAGLSTGNYNEVTARLYVDSLLLTMDRRLTREVEEVFDFLDHASRLRTLPSPKFRHLLVSPFNARRTILRMIEREKAKKEDGYILVKVNHLTDDKVTRRLREAADAGVRMDLIVRTTYAMLPHENIRAISILDRYLEHQRCYIFGRGEDRAVFMSSADMMERNLDWRVEVAFPVYDPRLIDEVWDMMQIQVQDNYKARVLDATQSNAYVSGKRGQKRAQSRTQEYFDRLGGKADPPARKTTD